MNVGGRPRNFDPSFRATPQRRVTLMSDAMRALYWAWCRENAQRAARYEAQLSLTEYASNILRQHLPDPTPMAVGFGGEE